MLKNYLTVAIRNLLRNKTYSFINIAGLAVGIAVFILIGLFAGYELSYDRYHEHTDDIYRIVYEAPESKSAVTHYPLASALKESVPGIRQTVRVEGSPRMICQYQDKVFYEDRILLTDNTFFDVFTFPFVKGSAQTALRNPGDLVITESTAEKYFGKENPIGKVIIINGQLPGTVTGVVNDVPENSQFRFDFLTPMSILNMLGIDMQSWNSTGIYTYVRLNELTDPQKIQTEIAGFLKNFLLGTETQLLMQPLTAVYLSSDFQFDLAGLGDIRYIYFFAVLGGLVLLIACINFINITTTQSLQRRGEIGVRKVVGAERHQLVYQQLSESMVYIIMALGLALILVQIFLPTFQRITGKALTIQYADERTLLALSFAIGVAMIVSSIYPALVATAFQPIEAIKKYLFFPVNRVSIKNSRKVLIVVQFACSVILITCTMIIAQQRNFIQDQKLGFNKEQIYYFPLGNAGENYNILKSELLKNPNVAQVALSQYLPMAGSPRSQDIQWENQGNNQVSAIYKYVDHDYLNLLETEFTEGRNFSDNSPVGDSNDFIVNEAAVRNMELDSPIGKRLSLNGQQGHIVGVVKDAHFRSFHYTIEPMIFLLIPDQASLAAMVQGIVYVRLNSEVTPASLSSVNEVIQRVAGNMPLEYHFLDQEYDALYRAETRIGTISNYASAIAIVLASVGLLGLIAFEIERRTKEIGIRKVVGASVAQVVTLLSKEFLVLVAIANVIAWPIAWYAMSRWLENFAYRIELGVGVFILAGALALVIALATVSWQTIRAAMANPVEALRYE